MSVRPLVLVLFARRFLPFCGRFSNDTSNNVWKWLGRADRHDPSNRCVEAFFVRMLLKLKVIDYSKKNLDFFSGRRGSIVFMTIHAHELRDRLALTEQILSVSSLFSLLSSPRDELSHAHYLPIHTFNETKTKIRLNSRKRSLLCKS